MMSSKQSIHWWALIGLCLVAIPAFLDFTIVNTALPAIQKQYNAEVLTLQWVTNSYAVVVAMLMIIAGRFGDIFGKRLVMYFGAIVFIIAALGGGFATSIDMLIGFRALMGLGAAALFILCGAVIADVADEKHQQTAIGIYTAVTGFALAIGPFLGGILVSLLSWRWVMWINIPFLVAGLFICVATMQSKVERLNGVKIDWWGFVFLLIGIGCLINGILNGSDNSFGELASWGLILIGILAMLMLFFVEKRKANPLLTMEVFSNKYLILAALNCIAAGFFSYVFFFFDPLYLHVVQGYDPFYAGLLLLAIPAAQVILSLFSAPLVKRFGLINLMLLSFACAVLGCLCHWFFHAETSFWFVIVAFLLMGVTWAMGNIGMLTAAHQQVSSDKVGGAIGTVATTWNVSGSICLAIGAAVFHFQEKSHQLEKVVGMTKDAFLSGFHSVALLFLAISVVLLMIGLVLRFLP